MEMFARNKDVWRFVIITGIMIILYLGSDVVANQNNLGELHL
jgi:hypothetical protein